MFIVENLENTHTGRNESKALMSTEVVAPNLFHESLASSCARGCFQRGVVAVMLHILSEHPSCGSAICYCTFPL